MNLEYKFKIYLSNELKDRVEFFLMVLTYINHPEGWETCPFCDKKYYENIFKNKERVQIPFGYKTQALYKNDPKPFTTFRKELKELAEKEFMTKLDERDLDFTASSEISMCKPCYKKMIKYKENRRDY
jgi:hypothetical protein